MLRQSITTLLLAGCALGALAVPAKPGILSYPQPDGTMLSVTLHGDEHGSWYETEDGYVLLPNAAGALEYATMNQGRLVSTGVRALQIAERPAAQRSLLASLPKAQLLETARKSAQESSVAARAPRRAAATTGLINNYPKTGSPKAMVLLVEFQDVQFKTPDANNAFQQLATQPGYSYGGATGSTLDYFKAQSGGIFTPDFQVFGPIRVDQNESYYGAAQGMNRDAQAWLMVRDACIKLHEQQPDLDWSEYDNDGDGFVDNIFVFYAGYGQNEGAPDWTIWPHSANLFTFYGIVVEYNGVKIGNYACTNELQGTAGTVRAGIGTFCHEYSHVLGLPDFYVTNGASSTHTPGAFELMDSGSYNNNGNTPPNYSAYERFCMGWMNPRELTGPEDVSLNPLDSGESLLITTDKAEEYFILENRQRTGWDTYLPGHGMLVWHVDYDEPSWINNKVNNDQSHQRIDLVEADNLPGAATQSGDPFPGTSNVRNFTSLTTPAMRCWTGYDPQMPLTDIHEAEGVITFKVKGGGEVLAPVTASEAVDVTPVSFTATWQPGVGAYEYEVDICKAPLLVPFLTLQVKDATRVAVTGLDPETEYSYVVRAVSDDRKSVDSNRISVLTLPPTFEQREVEPLEAENVGDSFFTARWNELEGAEKYHLSVVEKIPVNPSYQTVDFTKDELGNLLPSGWTTTSATTGSLKGYYGEAAPALRLTNSSDRLTSPNFGEQDVNSLSFWYRGNSTGDDSSLIVEALVDGAWERVLTVTPVDKTEAHTVSLDSESDIRMPQGAKAVRITFDKEGTGSVYIDDVVVGYGASYNSISHPDYDDADCGSNTSAVVENVEPSTTYYYSVRAVDSTGLSTPQSREVKVTTGELGAVESVEASLCTIITRAGVIEVRGTAGERVMVYDMAGRLEATARIGADGRVRIPAQQGLHLVAPFGKTVTVP